MRRDKRERGERRRKGHKAQLSNEKERLPRSFSGMATGVK